MPDGDRDWAGTAEIVTALVIATQLPVDMTVLSPDCHGSRNGEE
jgi:hypothetical protein